MNGTHRRHLRPESRTAYTLLELLIVVTIIGLITGVAIPRTRYLIHAIAVRGAATDAASMLELARHIAMTRGQRISVDLDSAPARLTMRAGNDTIRRRNENAMHGVHFKATHSPVVYTPLGMGFGVSNLSLYITRGAAAETVAVSRLGRVRR
jgi:prepilin-type N-terminal cleavage/methylation domain-containing protein